MYHSLEDLEAAIMSKCSDRTILTYHKIRQYSIKDMYWSLSTSEIFKTWYDNHYIMEINKLEIKNLRNRDLALFRYGKFKVHYYAMFFKWPNPNYHPNDNVNKYKLYFGSVCYYTIPKTIDLLKYKLSTKDPKLSSSINIMSDLKDLEKDKQDYQVKVYTADDMREIADSYEEGSL